MTRTYRMYVDTGISDRLMMYLRKELPLNPAYKPERFKATNFSRGPNANSYFDYELNLILDGTERYTVSDPENTLEVETYYNTYAYALIVEVQFNQLQFELLFDSGEPRKTKTHKYDIEPAVITIKTHLYDVVEFIFQTMTHKYNIE